MLDECKKQIESLRARFLFDSDDELALGPFSEQQFLLALASLDMAARYMQMAAYYYSRKE